MTDGQARVAVLTPHPIIAVGLITILAQSGGRFVPATFDSDGPEPDVAIFDAAYLEHDNTDYLDVLVSKTATPILILGNDLRPDLTARGLDRGADGFFVLTADHADVLAALESTMTGWVDGDAGANPTVGSSVDSRAHLSSAGAGLTIREFEVLTLIARGRSNQEIADTLFLGINTIKTYIRKVYAKIGATSRAQAVGWAIDHGLSSGVGPPIRSNASEPSGVAGG